MGASFTFLYRQPLDSTREEKSWPRNAFVEGRADPVSYANQDVLPPAAASPQANSSGSGLSATSVPRPIAVEVASGQARVETRVSSFP